MRNTAYDSESHYKTTTQVLQPGQQMAVFPNSAITCRTIKHTCNRNLIRKYDYNNQQVYWFILVYPRSTEGGKGVYWLHPDICPSVGPSVRPSRL